MTEAGVGTAFFRNRLMCGGFAIAACLSLWNGIAFLYPSLPSIPIGITDLNDIPIKYINGQTVFLRDVGQVHDGWAVQQNIVRNDGRRSVLLSVLKNGNASTLDVVIGSRRRCRRPAPCGRHRARCLSERSPVCGG